MLVLQLKELINETTSKEISKVDHTGGNKVGTNNAFVIQLKLQELNMITDQIENQYKP